MNRMFLFGLSVLAASTVQAQAQGPLKPALAGVAFLVGDWSNGRGKVADTGGTAAGTSRITVEVGGAVLLRRDHTSLADAAGKPAGDFEQIMLIYPEAGTLHADYSDGSHVIHYVGADVQPGQSVVFTSASLPNAPTFRLGYRLTAPDRLAVSFAVASPGSTAFNAIATGELSRSH